MSTLVKENQPCVFTVVANNYLPYARQLMLSVRTHSPDVRRVVFLCDRETKEYPVHNPEKDKFELIQIEKLDIGDFATMAFRYSLIELCTAIKPFCFNHLLDSGHNEIAYLDPDINTYSSLGPVFDLVAENNIVLTPHLTEPVNDDRRPNEIDILRAGAYNLGFLAVKASPETRKFINWWRDRLRHHCLAAPNKGLFVDQRWIDLVPSMFDGVCISKNPGFNVAYWNLTERKISRSNSVLLANNEPLIFIHYSGIRPHKPEFSHHQDRHTLDSLSPILNELTLDYIKGLKSHGASKGNTKLYAFSMLHNQEVISNLTKSLYIELEADLPINSIALDNQRFCEDFIRAINQPASSPSEEKPNPLISRAAYKVYESRVDLQERFPDIFAQDAEAFALWLLTSSEKNNLIPRASQDFIKSTLKRSTEGRFSATPSYIVTLYHRISLVRYLTLRLTNERTRKKLLRFIERRK